METGYLNNLVEAGKDDVLQYIGSDLGDSLRRQNIGAAAASLMHISMKNSRAELDILRTRAMIMSENEQVLARLDENDPALLRAMARAAGRVSQMRECFGALARVRATVTDREEARKGELQRIDEFLRKVEKSCVRLELADAGELRLCSLGDRRHPQSVRQKT